MTAFAKAAAWLRRGRPASAATAQQANDRMMDYRGCRFLVIPVGKEKSCKIYTARILQICEES